VSLSANDGEAVIAGPGAKIALHSIAPEIVAAMQRLAPPGEDEELLAESILAEGSVDSLARWYFHVDQLRQRGLVRRSLHADGRLVATLVSLCRSPASSSIGVSEGDAPPEKVIRPRVPRASRTAPASAASYVLSRFAYLRREGQEIVVESPLAHTRVIIHDLLAMAVLGGLAAPTTARELVERAEGLTPALVTGFISLLRDAGMLDQVSVKATSAPGQAIRCNSDSEDHSALDSWEFHDLLFHSRSRRGRSDGRFGSTYRFTDRPAPPALKPIVEREWHELYRPDLERLKRDDPPLAHVQDQRRSLRQYGEQAITARELGEFLFRVARVTKHWKSEVPAPTGPLTMDFVSRPYPSGGGLYELEFYLAVSRCEQLAAGLYYYDPRQHRLGRVCGKTSPVDWLLEEAAASAGIGAQTPQVLVILTARFERLAWKYESIAYSLILKHVGVVYQTMYLAATAMGLAPCALGCGDSDLFARAAGTDYYVETSVGEFLLGSKA
jgi:SagB-type dehydrogenase family enzyme